MLMPPVLLEPGAANVIHALRAAGYPAYAVGGCVRDSLLGKCPHDWDVTTAARPEQIIGVFGEKRCIPTGIKHGTVTVKAEGGLYEVTTFRTESGYSDGRHPDRVDFILDVTGDLARRDFTINAMAYNDEEGLIDPYGGQEDLLIRRIVRAVGDPMRRFEEDALRILRLFRFAAREELSIEEETLRAALALRENLRRISAERIRTELTGLLAAPLPGTVLPAQIAAVFLPDIAAAGEEAYARAMRRVDAAQREPVVRLAALLADSGEQAEAALVRLRFDSRTSREVAALIARRELEPCADRRMLRAQARRLLGEIGLKQIDRLEQLRRAQIAAGEKRGDLAPLLEEAKRAQDHGDCCKIADLAVTGRDLTRELGIAPGPQIGKLLSGLLERVTEGELPNERAVLLEAARTEDDEKNHRFCP